MRKKYIKTVAAGIGMTVALMAPKAEALTFELYKEFSEATPPAGNPPWLTATFTQDGENRVKLNMTATNLTENEYIDAWWFNTMKSVSLLSFSHISGEIASTIDLALKENTISADGGGLYDFRFNFPASKTERFGVGESSVYLITAAGLVESDFNLLSTPSGGNGTYYSAAHVGSIGTAGESGYIGDDTPDTTPVPEPSTFLLLGAGLFGLAVAKKRKASA